MAKRPAGQRSNLTPSSGRKQRTPTSTSHRGSRVEPANVTEKARAARTKKANRKKSA